MLNWGKKLSEFDICYLPRLAIKAQTLADFIVKCAINKEEKKSDDPGQTSDQNLDNTSDFWKIYVDGSSSELGSGFVIVVKSP